MMTRIPDPHPILKLGHAFQGARALLSAVELGVFSALADGPLDRDALQQRVGINQRGTRDFLDSLVALGMLTRDDDGLYRNTIESDYYLDRSKPTYIGAVLENFGTRNYAVWASLTRALRTGRAQTDEHTSNDYSVLYSDEKKLEQFVASMTARTRPVAQALGEKFPWKDYRTVIDIGTARGCLPVEIALVHSHIEGGGFDLPNLTGAYDSYVGEYGLLNRLRFYPGDFLKDPLPSAEVLVLGRVLHNWDLDTKKMLIKKAHDALPPSGALIVYERLIDDERRVNAAAMLSSLNMLLMCEGGFDFSGADCRAWMQETGFQNIRVEPLTDDQSMVIGIKGT